MATAQRLTAQEYLATPDETVRTELVEGEVIVQAPDLRHQRILRNLAFALQTWEMDAPGRGEVTWPIDVLIDDRNVFSPDLLWYADGHVPTNLTRPYAIPDLAVEVRSPSTWRYDVGSKRAAYERNGLAELWLIDTSDDRLLTFRRSVRSCPLFDLTLELTRADALTSPMLPAFKLALGPLLQR